jgi:RNA polymerase sigma-70 factor (ECF subfamily)
MSEATWRTLRILLVERYDDLVLRLSRHLGSRDLAEEAMQDTFLRLAREGEIAPVRDPRGYLYRMAFNLAAARRRSERRRLTVSEADAILDMIDEQPRADQIAEGRAQLALVHKAMNEMPARRRAIFEAAWIKDVPHREIAETHGLTLRMIQIELKHATEHVAERLDKAEVVDFAVTRRGASKS